MRLVLLGQPGSARDKVWRGRQRQVRQAQRFCFGLPAKKNGANFFGKPYKNIFKKEKKTHIS